MLLVRKTLTQLLLEVTDEKIQEISTETLSKYRKKGSCNDSKLLISLYFYYFLLKQTLLNLIEKCDINKFLRLEIHEKKFNRGINFISINLKKIF